ncbi:MAG: hypothetical protein F6K56_45705 [Moorea sp. SIO3G5]|nr:hypothetical protein [Moorena sp. SIO3G5]
MASSIRVQDLDHCGIVAGIISPLCHALTTISQGDHEKVKSVMDITIVFEATKPLNNEAVALACRRAGRFVLGALDLLRIKFATGRTSGYQCFRI